MAKWRLNCLIMRLLPLAAGREIPLGAIKRHSSSLSFAGMKMRRGESTSNAGDAIPEKEMSGEVGERL